MATVTVPTIAVTPCCEHVKITTERSGDRATTTVHVEGTAGAAWALSSTARCGPLRCWPTTA